MVFGYWLLIAGVTMRILMKRRAVPSAMAWLLVIYILPLFGIVAYLSFGELHLGKRRAERAKAMWPSTARWLKELKESRRIFATEYSKVAEPLFQLCNRRQGIDGVKGNQLQLLTTTDDTLKALIRDIELARHNIEMVFYIWQPGGLVDQVAESLMAAARRGVHCRLMLDSAGSLQFFRSPYIMLNAPEEKSGMAASIEDVSYELGGVLGVTLLGGLMTAVYSHSLALPAALPVSDLAYDSIDEALRLAAGMAADRAQQLTQLARLAFDRAFITVLIAAALLMALGAGVVKLALRK